VTKDTERVHKHRTDQGPNAGFIDPDVDSFGRGQSRALHLRGRYLYVVFIGGTLGTLARWSLAEWRPPAHGWSTGTMLANLAGAFLLGLILEVLMRRKDRGWPRLARLHFGTGFLGAFTTWSSLATQTVLLAESRMAEAALYLVVTVVGGVLAAIGGVAVGSSSLVQRVESRQ